MKMSREKLFAATLTMSTRLRQMLDQPIDSAPGLPSSSELINCLRRMFEIELNLRAAKLPEKAFRKSGMGRMICDTWDIRSALGTELLEIEQAYVDLEK